MLTGIQTPTSMRQVSWRLILTIAFAISGGCENDKFVLVVTPENNSLSYLSEEIQLTASLFRLSSGLKVENVVFTWASDDDEIATVDSTGVVTAVGPGTTNFSASAMGATGQAIVAVVQTPTSVEVSLPVPELEVIGDSGQLEASAFDAGGHLIPDTDFLWSSSDDAIVSVSDTGLATVVAFGDSMVTAATGEVTGTIFFSVHIPSECLRNITTNWDRETAQQMVRLSKGVNKKSKNVPDQIQWPPEGEPLTKCWEVDDPGNIVVSPEEYLCSEDILGGSQEEDTLVAIYKDRYSDDITISFRGSESEDDWKSNVQTTRVDWPQENYDPGLANRSSVLIRQDSVHRGFFCAYQSVRSQLKKKLKELIADTVVNRATARVYFTGHSLGGALAVLAALDNADWLVDSLGYNRANTILYSFAAPRAITEAGLFDAFRNEVPNSWQVVARLDVVPHFLKLTYTHTQNIVVLNSDPVELPSFPLYRSARIDIDDGRDYENCEWFGQIPPNPLHHNIGLYIDRLDNKLDPGIPNIYLNVSIGLMRMNWQGDLTGHCDRVALYKGDPFNGGQFEVGLGTLEWALQDADGTSQTGVSKGPRYYIVYVNGFSRILRSVKYEPHIPVFTLGRSTSRLFLKVKWQVDDEGLNDFVAVYDHKPTDGAWDDYRFFSRSAWADTNNDWDTPLLYKTEGHWVAYVVKEAGSSGEGKVIRQVKHIP